MGKASKKILFSGVMGFVTHAHSVKPPPAEFGGKAPENLLHSAGVRGAYTLREDEEGGFRAVALNVMPMGL